MHGKDGAWEAIPLYGKGLSGLPYLERDDITQERDGNRRMGTRAFSVAPRMPGTPKQKAGRNRLDVV